MIAAGCRQWGLFLLLTVLWTISPKSHAALTVGGLDCEHWSDPLGIDVTEPHLSWILQSTQRGDKQTAYQILVASRRELLDQDHVELWDSGKVNSDESLGIYYEGKPLTSSARVFWKVRVWDVRGQASEWSPTATWTMGILPESKWAAHWISAAGAEDYAKSFPSARHDFSDRQAFARQHPQALEHNGPNYSSLFARREFNVRPGLVRAVVHVCGLGHYVMNVNGERVGDAILTPGWTDYRKTVLYDTYEITSALVEGKNAIGILLGNGMYNIQPDYVRYVKFLNSFGPLQVIAQLRLEYADGSVETLGTDGAWQVAPGPVTYSNVFGGEDFDARLVQQGWDLPDFRPQLPWDAALVTRGPGGTLKGLSAAAPPVKATATLTPIRRTRLSDSTWVYDLGQNASIIPRLRIRGPRGSSVRIIPAELIGPDGAVDRRSATQDGVRPAWWQYTLADVQPASWRGEFFYQGARYLQVELFPAEDGAALPVIEDLTGVVVHSSAAPIGEFSTSNELFNRIYTLVRWAQRSNLMSVITDCPHREKLGWLEQYHLNGPSLRYNFDLLTLFRKGMNDMADSQLDNGLVPNIAPEFFIAGPEQITNGFRNSPEWGSSFVIVPWQQYQFSGDTALMRDYYDRMQRYVAFLASTAEDHIIKFGLGDWYDMGPKESWGSQLTPVSLTATAIYYYDNRLMSQMATLLGKPDDARRFEREAASIRQAFNSEFFDADRGTYSTGSQTANALPLFLDIVEPAHRQSTAAAIVTDIQARDNSFTSGDVGYRFLLKALAKEGRSNVIFNMNNQAEKPGYGYQLKMGATSLTEKWNAGVGSFGSQNHFMLGQINEWFFHDLAGIAFDEGAPGFKRVVVKPTVVGDLVWVKGRYDSVRGPIESRWQRDSRSLVMEISIPPNVTATVYIPTQRAEYVAESGSPAADSLGVKFVRQEKGAAVFEVESGSYQFVVSPFDP